MINPNVERLLQDIARECDKGEAYLYNRIVQLEQLCKDFWSTLRLEMDSGWIKSNRPRMEQLGLLEGFHEAVEK